MQMSCLCMKIQGWFLELVEIWWKSAFRPGYANIFNFNKMLIKEAQCLHGDAFRDAFLLVTDVKSDYLRYTELSVGSNQPGHSSDLYHVSIHRTGGFLVSAKFCVNSTVCCVWKSQEMSSFWNKKPLSSPDPSNHSMFKVHFEITFLPHSDVRCVHFTEALELCLHDL